MDVINKIKSELKKQKGLHHEFSSAGQGSPALFFQVVSRPISRRGQRRGMAKVSEACWKDKGDLLPRMPSEGGVIGQME